LLLCFWEILGIGMRCSKTQNTTTTKLQKAHVKNILLKTNDFFPSIFLYRICFGVHWHGGGSKAPQTQSCKNNPGARSPEKAPGYLPIHPPPIATFCLLSATPLVIGNKQQAV
jgi:hypothetical protein